MQMSARHEISGLDLSILHCAVCIHTAERATVCAEVLEGETEIHKQWLQMKGETGIRPKEGRDLKMPAEVTRSPKAGMEIKKKKFHGIVSDLNKGQIQVIWQVA